MTMKTLNQIKAQYNRMIDAAHGSRIALINRIYWRYQDNILACLAPIFDTPPTIRHSEWLNADNAAKIATINNTPVEAEIYTYQD